MTPDVIFAGLTALAMSIGAWLEMRAGQRELLARMDERETLLFERMEKLEGLQERVARLEGRADVPPPPKDET